MTDGKVLGLLADISERMEGEFHRSRRVLSFDEYLGLVAEHPRRYCRDAAQYLRDAFDHFGTSVVTRPWGEFKRFGLFDLAFLPQDESRRSGLVGQEHVQAEVYRVLSNFVREGRANKVSLQSLTPDAAVTGDRGQCEWTVRAPEGTAPSSRMRPSAPTARARPSGSRPPI